MIRTDKNGSGWRRRGTNPFLSVLIITYLSFILTAQVGRLNPACGPACTAKNPRSRANSTTDLIPGDYPGTPEGYLGSCKQRPYHLHHYWKRSHYPVMVRPDRTTVSSTVPRQVARTGRAMTMRRCRRDSGQPENALKRHKNIHHLLAPTRPLQLRQLAPAAISNPSLRHPVVEYRVI